MPTSQTHQVKVKHLHAKPQHFCRNLWKKMWSGFIWTLQAHPMLVLKQLGSDRRL